jgi:hypothetical protein
VDEVDHTLPSLFVRHGYGGLCSGTYPGHVRFLDSYMVLICSCWPVRLSGTYSGHVRFLDSYMVLICSCWPVRWSGTYSGHVRFLDSYMVLIYHVGLSVGVEPTLAMLDS